MRCLMPKFKAWCSLPGLNSFKFSQVRKLLSSATLAVQLNTEDAIIRCHTISMQC
jgi:hypothetical protein